MNFEQENLGTALEMLSCMLETGLITREEHPREFIRYDQVVEVRDALDFLAENLGLLICEYKGALYISPGVNNRVFSLKNTEIKIELGRGFNNPEMYTAFFIMHVIITEFYREAAPDSFRMKLPKDLLFEAVDKKIKAIADLENFEDINSQYKFNFKLVHDVWNKLPKTEFKDDSDEVKQRGVGSKTTIINQTIRFMQKHKLVEEHDDAIYLTDRCKAIIGEVYNNHEVQSDISNFIDSLSNFEGDENA